MLDVSRLPIMTTILSDQLHLEALDRYRRALVAAREADAEVALTEQAFQAAKTCVRLAADTRTRAYEQMREAEEFLDKALGGRPRATTYCASCDSNTCAHTGTRRAA